MLIKAIVLAVLIIFCLPDLMFSSAVYSQMANLSPYVVNEVLQPK